MGAPASSIFLPEARRAAAGPKTSRP
jgi:hypothetical protein